MSIPVGATIVLEAANAPVTDSSTGVDEITGVVKEQTAASNQIAKSVEDIAQMFEETHASIREATQAADMLRDLAAAVHAPTERFKVV